MKIDVPAVRKCLRAFEFATVFREHLGWDNHQQTLEVHVAGDVLQLNAIAQKRGFIAWHCPTIPDRATRLKIDRVVTKTSREHFVVYADQAARMQLWQWVRREPGRPIASRDHRFDATQSGDALIQRLEQIAVSLEEEGNITVIDMAGRARSAFDVDRITKKFFERFKAEHAAFLKHISGISPASNREWYTSLMLNRLMFVYFIQKKGFLDSDIDYLRNRLKQIQISRGQDQFQSFYRYFLIRLFHDGLGKSPEERALDPVLEKLLGKVPYLNGGYFEVHQLEESNPEIDIPDRAFANLFDFFDQYSWHLDERPLRADNEINPDVVGYIFEKYVNQKQMGAYYTKEDITEYIAKSTIIPYLFDAAKGECAVAFSAESAIWRLLRDSPERYIYASNRRGVISDAGIVTPLPHELADGVADFSRREDWNRPASDPFALPNETWRDYVDRRQRCLDVYEKLARGEICAVGDLVTHNLDLWQFARDAIMYAEGPDLLRAFWHTMQRISVLDPTCGSGAFLFAALQILETLYSDCMERMSAFVQDADRPEYRSLEDVFRGLIRLGESSTVEFKSSARWDTKTHVPNPVLEEVIVKTVAGFMNAAGGTLLIGVSDSGVVVGLQSDYQCTKPQNPCRDQFELWLTQYLSNALGNLNAAWFQIDFATLDECDVCRITVRPAPSAVLVPRRDGEVLYVRQGSATKPYLKASEILAYTLQHWGPHTIPAQAPMLCRDDSFQQMPSRMRPSFDDFRTVLAEIAKHPNERYYILKSIIINNLFGVDIMDEAVEICKLRLFLKLVAQVESAHQIEPLPDIDFNIRAGNTLVGYASLEQIRKSQEGKLGLDGGLLSRIEAEATVVEQAFSRFRTQQMTHGARVTSADKMELRQRLAGLNGELDRFLAAEYGIDYRKPKAMAVWKASHEPFHWLVEFYRIMRTGGFDIVIGNPPYVEIKAITEYRLVGYDCIEAGNLYALMLERSNHLRHTRSRAGFIVPVSSISTDRYASLQALLRQSELHYSSFDDRPSRLFDGLEHIRLTIHLLGQRAGDGSLYSTRYNKWTADSRPGLFSSLVYTRAKPCLVEHSMPKLSHALEEGILKKLANEKARLSHYFRKRGTGSIFYSRKVGYFMQVLDFVPEVRDGRGVRRPPTEFKELRFADLGTAQCALAILNSSLFYWFVTLFSDCRHLNKREIEAMPINLDELSKGPPGVELRSLAPKLMEDLQRNSELRNMRFSHDTLTVQCIRPKLSKSICDAIDYALAAHYGFTESERDFLVNYDIKFRMGGADTEDAG